MTRRLPMVFAALALAGCASGPPDRAACLADLTYADTRAIMREVAYQMGVDGDGPLPRFACATERELREVYGAVTGTSAERGRKMLGLHLALPPMVLLNHERRYSATSNVYIVAHEICHELQWQSGLAARMTQADREAQCDVVHANWMRN